MSTEARARFARLVTTKLLLTRPTSACVRLQIGKVSHEMALACANGRFVELLGQVHTVLEAWFHEAFSACDHEGVGKSAAVIAQLIRDRHEHQLVAPADPRRLPLTLPRLATGESTWRKHRRREAVGV